jgi:hypothetical protein
MKKTILLLVVVFGFSATPPAKGQSFMFWGEAGRHQNRLGNGTTSNGAAVGFGFNAILGGDASKDFAVLFPVGFEIRGDQHLFSGDGTADLLGTGDLAFRIKRFSFGPGANFGYMFRPDAVDPTCSKTIRPPDGSSCNAANSKYAGTRDIGNFFGFGLSGFAKINFGPQGRSFVQGRYIHYSPSWILHQSGAAFASQYSGLVLPLPTDFPQFQSGNDIRISAGYVFGGADSIAKIVRVQYTDRKFDFMHEKANVTGVFDQRTRQLSFGFGLMF